MLAELYRRYRIDGDGNVRFLTGRIKDRNTPYREAIDIHCGNGPNIEGVGVSGPWVKFRN